MTSPSKRRNAGEAAPEAAPTQGNTAAFWRTPGLIFLCALAVYAMVAGDRLKGPSPFNHFTFLADSLLHGQLANRRKPPNLEDWAKVETLELKDGRTVKGAFLKTGVHRFRTLQREEMTVDPADIAQRSSTYYVSFPPLPAALMMPGVAIFGYRFNDVVFNLFFAAANCALIYILLRRLRQLGYSARTDEEDLWLTAAFAFGSVHFFCSVLGQVWYTGQLVGLTMGCLYVLAALEGRHPLLTGVFLALAFSSRPPWLYAFPFFVAELLRAEMGPLAEVTDERRTRFGGTLFAPLRWLAALLYPADGATTLARLRWGSFWKKVGLFCIPFVVVGLVLAAMNQARFGNPTVFGHEYLDVRWTARIQKFGLFNYAFLSKNLAAALVLLPRILAKAPYIKISWHGMSLLITTPLLAYLIWPRRPERALAPEDGATPGPVSMIGSPWRGLWLSLVVVAFVDLLYQNTGWVQFGYRFMLDWAVFAFGLLALQTRSIGSTARALIVVAIIVNTFGAITFNRMRQFYFDGFFPSE
jgi:hypothetical protein